MKHKINFSHFLNCFFILILAMLCVKPSSAVASNKQCVILLHGLGRTHYSMISIESMLRKNGYEVVNWNYPSRKQSIESLAANFIPEMVNQCLKQKPEAIHFVTHSLGGIILQTRLKTNAIPKLSRIVMLSPPNHGSPIADLLKDNYLYKKITGPAGQELLTSKMQNSIELYQKPQIGIIAGNRNYNPLGQFLFNEDNDGKVSVSSAKSEKMSDFIALPVSHTFMMNNKIVKRQVLYFLRFGKFYKIDPKRTGSH